MKRALAFFSATVLVLVAPLAKGQDVEQAPPPPIYTGLELTARGGMMTTSSTDRVLLGPALGLGIEGFFTKNLGLALHYDAGISSRGTSIVDTRRITQQLVVTFDARVYFNRAVSLGGGVGGGGSWLLVTTTAFDDSRTTGALRPALAAAASLDVEVPQTSMRLTVGATGLLHEDGRDVLYSTGIAWAF